MYRVHRFEGIITALSPIFHGGDEKTGSTPVLRTTRIYNDAYEECEIPYLSGNGIRGKLRRIVMRDFLEMVGYEIQSAKLYHSLFAGGVLEGGESLTGIIDIEMKRQIRSLIPPIALFGCAVGNQMIQGILKVEHMWPICEEYRPYLPERFRSLKQASRPVRSFTGGSFITRRDDLRAEREEDEQAVQMKVEYECFVPGAAFYHSFVVELPDDVQLACFGRMMELFAQAPYIGGRSSSGDGKVRLEYENIPSSAAYVDYVNQKKSEIVDLLRKLDGTE